MQQNEEIEKKDKNEINIYEENLNEEEEEEEDTKENDDEEYELPSTSSKNRRKIINYITFDEKYDYNNNYFYQELTSDEVKEITLIIENFLSSNNCSENLLSFALLLFQIF